MKKYFMGIFLFLSAAVSFAQWQPDLGLVADPADSYLSYNNTRCIATSGALVCVVWWDIRDGNREIYFKRSTDAGLTWDNDTRLTNNTAWSDFPCIAISGSVIHVIWMDDRNESYYPEIYYKRSSDGGLTWGEDVQLTSDPSDPGVPSIAAIGSDVHIVWHDIRDGNWEIYYKRSTDGGLTWGPDQRLTNDAATSERPSIAVTGTEPNEEISVVWDDDRDGDKEIYFVHSSDGGVTWQSQTRLTSSIGESEAACIGAFNSNVHVTWVDSRDGNSEIYYKKSTDSGLTWGDDMRLTNDPVVSANPSIALSGNNIHIVWIDWRENNEEVYYKHSTDNGTGWDTDTRLTDNPANSENAFIAISGQVVHVLWQDKRNGNEDIFYKQNPTGNLVTGIGDNSGDSWVVAGFDLFPNPTKGKFQISNSKCQTNPKFEIIDLCGNILVSPNNGTMEQCNNGTIKFDISDLPAGIYFIRISSLNLLVLKKIVKL
jgi:hypothetical protein